MGHYCAEMFPNGEDRDFSYRWAKYQQECAREIEEIISKNPIKFEEIKLGEKLSLYAPLKSLSKIRFDNEGEFHKIRELFDCRMKYYSWGLWALSYIDDFTVYDKRVDLYRETEKHPLIRINKINREFDWLQYWVGVKYFEKKVSSQ